MPRKNTTDIYDYLIDGLTSAIHRGDFDEAKRLLKEGADPNKTNNRKEYTAVHQVVFSNEATMLHLLLEYGADIDAGNWHNVTALQLSFTQRNIKVAKLLIELGADMYKENNFHRIPLDFLKWSEGYHDDFVQWVLSVAQQQEEQWSQWQRRLRQEKFEQEYQNQLTLTTES